MSRYLKGLIQDELKARFAQVGDFVVVQTKGIDGIENNQMRGVLKDKGIQLTVVKNSMMRRAMESLGRAPAASLFLAGPCAVAYGSDSVVDLAKELVAWSKKLEAVKIKGAYVDGQVMGAQEAAALAAMPTRAELQGRIAQVVLSAGANLVGVLLGPGARMAGCVKSLIERREKEAA